jgi:hypothetical protein
LCVHDKGDGNPHAHILLTLRAIDGDHFGKKNREWNQHALIEQWREQLADLTNQALERYGFLERVSHLSYAAQGIDRQPTIHLGRYAHQLETNGYYSERGEVNNRIREDNAEREQLRAERQQAELELAREQSRLAQDAEQLRQREEATRRQRERQAVKGRETQPERELSELRQRYDEARKPHRLNRGEPVPERYRVTQPGAQEQARLEREEKERERVSPHHERPMSEYQRLVAEAEERIRQRREQEHPHTRERKR